MEIPIRKLQISIDSYVEGKYMAIDASSIGIGLLVVGIIFIIAELE